MLEAVVTVSDEPPPFTNSFLVRVAGCSTMITEPALRRRQGTRRYSAENPAADGVAQPPWYDSGRDGSQVPVHLVIPGHLHSLLARGRLDHRQRLGAGGAARYSRAPTMPSHQPASMSSMAVSM